MCVCIYVNTRTRMCVFNCLTMTFQQSRNM